MYILELLNGSEIRFNSPEAMKAWGSALVCDNGVVCSRALVELERDGLLKYWEITDKLVAEAQK